MKRIKIEESKDKIYFYDELQHETLDYYQFQSYAKKRFVLHRMIENKSYIANNIGTGNQEEDINEHFCLRLICAQTTWSSLLFVKLEVQIFEKRMQKCQIITLKKLFLNDILNKLTNLEIDREKKVIKIKYNTIYLPGHNNNLYDVKDWTMLFYFTHIIDILQFRSVDVNDGYINNNDNVLKVFILNIFRKFLTEKINSLFFKCKYDQDERILKFYEHLFTQNHKQVETSLTLKADEKYFPPCITGLIQKLKTSGHLKHRDRLVLTRFFKDSGMKVDECIQYFKSHFRLKKENFDKEYLYSIRHTYGLEGKRASYHAFSCLQVIDKSGDNSSFGCPFSNNKQYIQEFANNNNFEEAVLFDIEELMKKWKCKEACTLSLGTIIQEKIPEKEGIITPINYFKKFKEKIKQKDGLNKNDP